MLYPRDFSPVPTTFGIDPVDAPSPSSFKYLIVWMSLSSLFIRFLVSEKDTLGLLEYHEFEFLDIQEDDLKITRNFLLLATNLCPDCKIIMELQHR